MVPAICWWRRNLAPVVLPSRDFTTTAVMLDNGNPASTKSIRGWVEGSLTSTIETDVITGISPDGSTLTFSGDKNLAKLQPVMRSNKRIQN